MFCADFFIYFLRLLQLSRINSSLGPKLLLIKEMVCNILNLFKKFFSTFSLKVFEMIIFMFIMGVFIISFGVITQSSLYPGQPFNFQLLRNIINNGYWSIFGDMRITNQFILDVACDKRGDCDLYPQHAGTNFIFFIFTGYCVIANVLLINLLIALFRY